MMQHLDHQGKFKIEQNININFLLIIRINYEQIRLQLPKSDIISQINAPLKKGGDGKRRGMKCSTV